MEEYFGCSDTDSEKWKKKMRLATKTGVNDFWSSWKIKCVSCSIWMYTCCAEFVYDLCHSCWENSTPTIKKGSNFCSLVTNPAFQPCTYCLAREEKQSHSWRWERKLKRARLSQTVGK